MSKNNDRYTIQVLQKALRILDLIQEARRPLSLEDISDRAQMPKSTTFRIITNLLNNNYLTELPEGYWLGLKLLSLGIVVEEHIDIRKIAEPMLMTLRDQTGETVYLAALMQDLRVLYLSRAASTQPIAVTLKNAGMTIDAHCSALGKSLLAYQPDTIIENWLSHASLEPYTPNTLTSPAALRQELQAIRAQGYAVDDEENQITICCIAAPIFDAHGQITAAVSVAGPKQRMPHPLIGSDMAHLIVDTARQISFQIGMPLPVE
ncbi:MAG: IclR family transcriptional regulator [Anaerolineae bacterium]